MSTGNGEHIKCKCGGNLDAVMESRPRMHKEFGQVVARRRQCDQCGKRSSTYEIHESVVENIRRDFAKKIVQKLLDDVQKLLDDLP
jgi:transcriptional regulator NrdR family protein